MNEGYAGWRPGAAPNRQGAGQGRGRGRGRGQGRGHQRVFGDQGHDGYDPRGPPRENFDGDGNWRQNDGGHNNGNRIPRGGGNYGGNQNPRGGARHRDRRNIARMGNVQNDGNQNNERRTHEMGFRGLEEMCQTDAKDIILKINEKKLSFTKLLESPIDRKDMFVLVIKVLAKVCQSPFDELKLKLLLEICESRFLSSFLHYLTGLPYAEEKRKNQLYWNNQQEFWENFIMFCENIVNLSPSTALRTCRTLIEGSSKLILELLQQRHGFELPEHLDLKLKQLRDRLIHCEEDEKSQKKKKQPHTDFAGSDPPDDFRALSVVPSRDDLRDPRPFVRPNIVQGSYRDTEHYLDVQFRLLREDCFGPLRDGIAQFIENPNKKKFDNIRVYRNVKFVENYISKTKVGMVIKLDVKTIQYFKRVNWAHSKRFIYGSLLLLTRDNCKTFIPATIVDRDPKLLVKGMIPISIVDNMGLGVECRDLCNDVSYVMIESEVYFEPYFHVLKALQDPKFPEHLAMSKYIVNVDPVPQHPAYLEEGQNYAVETRYSPRTKFVVLDPRSWPTKEDLGLNNSQYEAYRLALTHEFAVIQGPPGTGKTYLGIKIAQTLLNNLTAPTGACLMLMICYTNHALDQFLEAMLPLTDSIVRIGGQSRNEAMEKINLTSLRKKTKVNVNTNRLFYEQRDNLKLAIAGLRHAQDRVDNLNNGILSYDCLKTMVPESQFLGQFYANYQGDPLKFWLLQGREYYLGNFDFEALVGEQDPEQLRLNIEDEDGHLRTDPILDVLDMDATEYLDVDILADLSIKTSFSIEDTEKKLAATVKLYRNTLDMQQRREIERHIFDLKSRIDLFTDMETNRYRAFELEVNRRTNFDRLSIVERWMLYFKWANVVLNEIRRRMQPLQRRIQSASIAYEEARMLIDMETLRGIKVVGMTTSGAARLRKLLMALAPQIVIVEEAAEVLEQHIVTSLTKHCQHLILIGDHQQLRPSAAHMKLARHFNLEISLFERMITNGIHSRRLEVQHRMRPELAALICPHIYPDLENHPSVEQFPAVRGMTDNLFFFTHEYKEEQVEDSASRSNHLEADMTMKLANYLMQQGYKPEDITVLAAYSGQMFYMRKERDRYKFLSKVKITVVDNYQGEESKIILLSLVRNNTQNEIGFLGTENRICVALSRAREGFYIFGNIDILKKKSELWSKISTTLQKNGSLGSYLMLKCENHSDQITTIHSPDDFAKVPEGGCLLKCSISLPKCGHPCPLVCHGYDRGHVESQCLKPCERKLCEWEHVCPLKCWEDCGPCRQPVAKILRCGHKKTIPCHKDPADFDILCFTSVTVKLPSCGHEVEKPCHMRIERVRCSVPCVYRVAKCGHECRRNCHVKDDPEHERYLCEKPCPRPKQGCSLADILTGDRGNHQCSKKCYETCDDCTVEVKKKRSNCTHSEKVACNINVDEKPCRKNCARRLECGHFCKKKCFEPCGDCKQKVKKPVPGCNHQLEVICMETVTREMCKAKCERILSCGHPCTQLCGKQCDIFKCTHITAFKHNSPCGHRVQLPCNVYRHGVIEGVIEPEMLLKHCQEPCKEMLACEHHCAGTCSQCYQRRLHVACKGPCDRPNVCGHLCKQPCNQACPPCNQPCEIKCQHSHCGRRCGAPCVPCQEPCTRECRHGKCTNRCGEPCTRAPCDEPCDKTMACGHPCRGLCGEPCPDLCKICRPEDFPRDVINLGDEYDDDAKFVKLEDCKHVESVENMDNLMKGDQAIIEIKKCHFCRKPVINTHRYKDLISDMYKKGINAVKERVYGNAKLITQRRKELEQFILQVSEAVHDGHAVETIEHWDEAFHKIKVEFTIRKEVSLLQLETQHQYLNILLMVAENYAEYTKTNNDDLKEEMRRLVQLLCRVLMQNASTISQQFQMDIGNELKRMSGIIQLSKTLGHESYLSLKTSTKVQEAAKNAKSTVLTWKRYDQEQAVKAIKELQDSVKVHITKEERDLVIRAIGSKAGSWYKCPNGHIYSIGACGGAMEVSKCADCGAAIGGQNHALLGSNRHAGEVDGSRQSAWPGAAMDMANYEI